MGPSHLFEMAFIFLTGIIQLFGSGLVAGGGLIGVLSAGLIAGIPSFKAFTEEYTALSFMTGTWGEPISLIMVLGLATVLFLVARSFGGKKA
ncbi:MAG: hypothetical protein V3V99_03455 [candidate division Zixibacteria bacterium]